MNRIGLNLFVLVFLFSWKFVVLSQPTKVNTSGTDTYYNTSKTIPKHMHIFIKGKAKGSKLYPHRRKGGDPGNNYYHKHPSKVHKQATPFQIVTTPNIQKTKEMLKSAELYGSTMPDVTALGTNKNNIKKPTDTVKNMKKTTKIIEATNKMTIKELDATTPYTEHLSHYTYQVTTPISTKEKTAPKPVDITTKIKKIINSTGVTDKMITQDGTAGNIKITKSNKVTMTQELDDTTDNTKIITKSTEVVIQESDDENNAQNTKLLTSSSKVTNIPESDDDRAENMKIMTKNTDVITTEELDNGVTENKLKMSNNTVVRFNQESSSLLNTKYSATSQHTTKVPKINTKEKVFRKPADVAKNKKNNNTNSTKKTKIITQEPETTQNTKKMTKRTELTDIQVADNDKAVNTGKNTKSTEMSSTQEQVNTPCTKYASYRTSKVLSRINSKKKKVQKPVDAEDNTEEITSSTPRRICWPVEVVATIGTEATTTPESVSISSSESVSPMPVFNCEPDEELKLLLNGGPPLSFTPNVDLNFGSEIPVNCSDIEALMDFPNRNVSLT